MSTKKKLYLGFGVALALLPAFMLGCAITYVVTGHDCLSGDHGRWVIGIALGGLMAIASGFAFDEVLDW